MADSTLDFPDEAEEANELKCDSPDMCDFPQTLVTEKIIFVIDIQFLATDTGEEDGIETVLDLCKGYYNLKKKICIKPPEFECLLYNNTAVIHSHINHIKDLQAALLSIQSLECEEDNEPLQMDEIFNKIAGLVELPDPACAKKCLPPNWVYHVIWLFSRNLHVPTMENTNSFDFLMMTPYFALDMLYVYNRNVKDSKYEYILKALLNLNENGKGYFLKTGLPTRKDKLFSCFAQFLGHPLIRVPQKCATFSVHSLCNEVDIHNDKEN